MGRHEGRPSLNCFGPVLPSDASALRPKTNRLFDSPSDPEPAAHNGGDGGRSVRESKRRFVRSIASDQDPRHTVDPEVEVHFHTSAVEG